MIDRIEISQEVFEQIQRSAVEVYPNEMCGFLLPDSFVRVTNYSHTPDKSFIISALDRVLYPNAIAVVHTHVANGYTHFDIRTPSVEDCEGQEKSGLPWLIYSTDGLTISSEPIQIPRYPNPNYENRPFITGFSDCYSIVQDWYWFNLGIVLKPHIVYSVKDIVTGKTTFDNFIKEFGFYEIPLSNLQEGDLLLLNNGTGSRNHLGIYTDGKVLHQDELSRYEPFENFHGMINAVLRHESNNS